jgi:hypothetical protein
VPHIACRATDRLLAARGACQRCHWQRARHRPAARLTGGGTARLARSANQRGARRWRATVARDRDQSLPDRQEFAGGRDRGIGRDRRRW